MKEWYVEIIYNFYDGGNTKLSFKPFAKTKEETIKQAKDATFSMYGTSDGTVEVAVCYEDE